MKYRTYGMLLILIIISLLMVSTQVGATAPRYMKLTYQSDTLQMTILHFSPLKSAHYVYKVDVEKNGQPYLSELYSNQPKFFFYSYQYNVTAISGDQLTVTANCNLFGKLTRSITVS
ncbi:MAG: hypothetical protein KKC68_02040 [Candidatus Thermoplasmatota archaeon]|nr:hypothetical protein [Candidatus Thermoplasmatota archaeon]MBU1940530.1 hypothetical protein [Candidatus Thermoplasmatota archaeon]